MYYIKKYPNLTNLTKGGDGIEGYKHTKETKRKFSEQKKGEKNPFFQHKHSNKTLKNLSKKGKERWDKGMFSKPPAMFGKHNSSSKKRIIINPQGQESIVYSLEKFCNENKLSLFVFRKNINLGPILKSRNKNNIGWEIKEDL